MLAGKAWNTSRNMQVSQVVASVQVIIQEKGPGRNMLSSSRHQQSKKRTRCRQNRPRMLRGTKIKESKTQRAIAIILTKLLPVRDKAYQENKRADKGHPMTRESGHSCREGATT